MKKALIITYYWPPAGGSGVQRWLKFVKYLRDFGIEPVIYTVENPDYPLLDTSLQKDIPEGVEVLKQPIWEPYKLASIFSKKKNVKTSAGFLSPKKSLASKVMTYVRANYFIPDARMFWIKPSISYLEKYLKENPVDFVITTGPPHSLHLIGLGLKEKLNTNWIADFRDPWTKIDYFHQLPLTKKAKKKHHFLEEKVLKKADKVLVVGRTMKKEFDAFSNEVYVVENGFDSEISEDHKFELDSKFLITHIGLMNADRNHEIFWKSLQELCHEVSGFKEDLNLKLIGKLDVSVLDAIKKYDLENNVEIIDYLPHDEVIAYQRKSQVLLLSVNNVPSAKAIITGKIFEYLMAKRPIIGIAPKDGDLAEILKETNSGVVADFQDKEKLKQIISEYYTTYQKGNLSVQSKNIEKYHRRELTKKMVEIINS
ncbi:glycosyltransferase [Aureivirga sp. CE67]|uniref:glycosyltransferase n=1 Tax=Aureivirga sp. CE67 TaxID=1788983 RepID=UPI0018CABBC6|nr:glycosyltransferase [Aureivirga sp. CE67]